MKSFNSSYKEKFSLPEFYHFKPFFTLQPVAETREKQLNCWCSIALNYCAYNNVNTIDPTSFLLFHNDAIGRQLSNEGILAVTNRLIHSRKNLTFNYKMSTYLVTTNK